MRRLITLLLLLMSIGLCAQKYSKYQNYSYRHYDRYLYTTDSIVHTSTRPFELNSVKKVCDVDSLYHIPVEGRLKNIVLNRSLIQYKKEKGFQFTADPLMNFEFGKVSDSSGLSTVNTRGVLIEGTIGEKVAFQTRFYENQALYNDFRKNALRDGNVVPGQGMGKKFKETGLDYASSQGYLSYTPSEYLNVMCGHGKHFWGDGYRSLMLSDNSLSYPFLKVRGEAWRLKYDILYAQFIDPYTITYFDDEEKGYGRKWGVFHYLDFVATDWLSFGVFESVIWQNADSLGNRGFDVNYLNPVVFFRPVEYSIGSPDNVLMGLNGKIRPIKNVTLYGQFMIDEFFLKYIKEGTGWWGNKFAFQGGLKAFDIGVENLDVQFEGNLARPYTYSHRTTLQNYSHYKQSLAHPLGANFYEGVGIVKYRYKRLFLEAKTVYSIFGLDKGDFNYGKNIFRSYYDRYDENGVKVEFGHEIGQGLKTKMLDTQLTASFLVNPASNLNVSVGLWLNKYSNEQENASSTMLVFALRTSLENFYFDTMH